LSAADSPFDLSGLGSTFFLEDFEDGELNTPGFHQLPPTDSVFDAKAIGIVVPPGEFTNSVDGDAGGIDGSGNDGRCLQSTHARDFLSAPPIRVMTLRFEFDPDILGFYPDSFGFVWTDGIPGSTVSVTIEDPDGVRQGMQFVGIGDELLSGTTADNRFMGVVHSPGISQVWVMSLYQGNTDIESFQIDHAQYGHTIPEPLSFGILLTSVVPALLLFRKGI
jgi:hypothetical protein